MSPTAPKPPAGTTDEAILLRIKNRSARLSRIASLPTFPVFLLVKEKALLDVAYDEWARRQREAGFSTEPDFQD